MSPKATAAVLRGVGVVQGLRDAFLTGERVAFSITLPVGVDGTVTLEVNVAHPDKLDTMTEAWLASLVRMVEDRALAEAKVRRCKHPGCDTVLSNYNKREWCSVHERDHPFVKIPKRR